MIHRRLLAMASVVPLLLCVATAVLWVRSYQSGCAAILESATIIGKDWRYQNFDLVCDSGEVGFIWLRNDYTWTNEGEFHRHHFWRTARGDMLDGDFQTPSVWNQLGFLYYDSHYDPYHAGVTDAWAWYAPAWCLMLSLLVPPMVWWRLSRVHWLRRRRRGRGQCVGCGYDLRASPEGCPECGAPCKGAGPAVTNPVWDRQTSLARRVGGIAERSKARDSVEK